jgi:hypothetical protein
MAQVRQQSAVSAERVDHQRMKLRAPRDSRSLFDLFGTYDPARGLDELLFRLDVTGIEPRHIYNSILGRQPDSLKASRKPDSYNARDHMRGGLRSPEFQRKIISLMLAAYPEKRRLLFVHVPKCAGTDLRIGLSARYPALGLGLTNPEWTSRQQLYDAIHRAAVGMQVSDTILLHGHERLATAVDGKIVRPTDTIITVIRDPVEIVLSNINYIITRILQDQESGKDAPDTKEWRIVLGIDKLPPEMPDEFIAQLFSTMLHNPTISIPNSICYWLGNGDVQSVIKRLVLNDVEITNTKHYTAWLRERWHITREAKANESRKFVTEKHIHADDRKFIETITADDRKVYELLSRQIDESDRHAIFGREITGIEEFT